MQHKIQTLEGAFSPVTLDTLRYGTDTLIKVVEKLSKMHSKDTNRLYLQILYLRYSPTLQITSMPWPNSTTRNNSSSSIGAGRSGRRTRNISPRHRQSKRGSGKWGKIGSSKRRRARARERMRSRESIQRCREFLVSCMKLHLHAEWL